jgi:hypothetical protein
VLATLGCYLLVLPVVVRVLQPLMETRALLVAQTEPIFASLANGT